MERARFISHHGIRILQLDGSGCSIEEAQELIESAIPLIRGEPKGTVLTLTTTDGGKFDSQVIKALKEFTKGNKPYVKAAAIVGITGIQRVVLDTVSIFSNREFATFDNLDVAKDYLVSHAG